MELKEELILYKKEVVEQHEKGFQKAVRQAGFFVKDLDLGLFDPFKDMKDGPTSTEQGNDACVQVAFVFIFFLLCWNLFAQAL